MRKVLAVLLAAMITHSLSAYATADPGMTQDDVDQLNQDTTPEQDPSELVEQAIDDWFAKKKIEPGLELSGGKIYYSETEVVSVKPADPGWVKARQLAFEKALLALQSNFITDQYAHSTTETLDSREGDDSSNTREFEDKSLKGKSRLEAIWDKALAAGEAKLNQMLVGNGVDPSELDSVPPAERKNLFIRKYITHTVTKAMGDSSGLLPLKTFEGNDSKGTHVVGVIAAYSPKFKQLAYDIAHGREPATARKKGKELASWYDLPPEVMAQTFGLRVAVDENGEIALLSFGQWGYSYSGSNQQQKARARKAAGEQAETIAIAQVTNFMNSRLSLADESKRGEVVENYLLKQGDDITEKDITNLVDQFSKDIRQTSSGSVAGVRTVSRWKYQHPYGQEIIGRVKVWTREGYEGSQNLKNFKPTTSRKPVKEQEAGEQPTQEGGVSESPEFADPEDFF